MAYIARQKQLGLDYDVFINDKVSDFDKEETKTFIEKVKQDYDVVFCSPRVNVPPFNDGMYLLPKLKDKFSTGYDVGIKGTSILDSVKRIELGVKTYMPEDFSVEMKLHSGTFKKYEVILSELFIDTNSYLAEFIPILYINGHGKKDENGKPIVPILNQFDYTDMGTRLDYLQLKFIQVNTHIVEPIFRSHPLKVVGVVCQEVWDNFSDYFPSDRKGGFGSTDDIKSYSGLPNLPEEQSWVEETLQDLNF